LHIHFMGNMFLWVRVMKTFLLMAYKPILLQLRCLFLFFYCGVMFMRIYLLVF